MDPQERNSLTEFLTFYKDEFNAQPFSYQGSLLINGSLSVPIGEDRNFEDELLASKNRIARTNQHFRFLNKDDEKQFLVFYGIEWNRIERFEPEFTDIFVDFQFELELLFVATAKSSTLTYLTELQSESQLKQVMNPVFKDFNILPALDLMDGLEIDSFSAQVQKLDLDEKEMTPAGGGDPDYDESSDEFASSVDSSDSSDDESSTMSGEDTDDDQSMMINANNMVRENNNRTFGRMRGNNMVRENNRTNNDLAYQNDQEFSSEYIALSRKMNLEPFATYRDRVYVFSIPRNLITSEMIGRFKQLARNQNLISSDSSLIQNLNAVFINNYYDEIIVGVQKFETMRPLCFLTLIRSGYTDIPQCGTSSKLVDMIMQPSMVNEWEESLMQKFKSLDSNVVGVYVPVQLVKELHNHHWSIQDDCGSNNELPPLLAQEINNVLWSYERLESQLLQTSSVLRSNVNLSDGVQRYLLTKKL